MRVKTLFRPRIVFALTIAAAALAVDPPRATAGCNGAVCAAAAAACFSRG